MKRIWRDATPGASRFLPAILYSEIKDHEGRILPDGGAIRGLFVFRVPQKRRGIPPKKERKKFV